MEVVRPDEHDDPVAAVLAAHRIGAVLALATSGTSGTARRVLRSTSSWWAGFAAYSRLSRVAAGARVWLPGPDTSTMVLFGAVHAAVVGAARVLEPGVATHACLTPAQLERRGGDLPAGTMVVVAGAHLPGRALAAAVDRGLGVAHYYGAAELSFVAAGEGAGGLRPFPGVEIDLRDTPAPGTIWVRSSWVCDGYEGPPGALLRDGDWASVGDVGRLRDGVLEVLGRPDAVTTAGATVLVADVEAALAPVAHGPFAVHGLPHESLGEVLAVTVVDPADRARLQDAARRLPATHRPRRWRIVGALPVTAAGKLDRGALSGEAALERVGGRS
ncbi:long-chain fatty acid--CoA ligase [Intrasporangium sp.]|uniref:long-chain fatty acid--CoA ligase n=1 Tax=Intrasporangium sp. TaxID=1925024 RepID=UPI0032221B6C